MSDGRWQTADARCLVGNSRRLVQVGTSAAHRILGSRCRPQHGEPGSDHDAVHDQAENIWLELEYETFGDEGADISEEPAISPLMAISDVSAPKRSKVTDLLR